MSYGSVFVRRHIARSLRKTGFLLLKIVPRPGTRVNTVLFRIYAPSHSVTPANPIIYSDQSSTVAKGKCLVCKGLGQADEA